jgi:hypothetical protein
LKYLDYKKDVDLDAYVRVFYATIRANGETFEEYIINAFSYTLREMASNWCHNYMSKYLNCIFFELTQMFYKCHWKTLNVEHIYMGLKNINQGETK